ncbi:PE family protein, partial [Mycobacterium tuberculosis]|uniref:PE family protein n=1 Tax=Mycobacterium tuberculosis TaxID=1773 RepID=UPI0034CEFE42
MSFLVVVPEFLTSAAADVENIGSTLRAANAAAAASTTALAAAGADEVSAAVAALFARFGQEYQAVSAQASAFHQQFVQTLNSASGSYAAAEATIASQLQTAQHDLLGAVNAPTETLLGRPLIGDGAPGTATSPHGGAGGLLYGNGGNGCSATASGSGGGARGFAVVAGPYTARGDHVPAPPRGTGGHGGRVAGHARIRPPAAPGAPPPHCRVA